jgi:hypothetical protein
MHFKLLSAALALTGVASLLIYYITTRLQRYLRLKHIPGPALASWSNIWLWKVLNSGSWRQEAIKLDQKYGPVVRYGPERVMFSQLEALQLYGISNVMQKVLLQSCSHRACQSKLGPTRPSATML